MKPLIDTKGSRSFEHIRGRVGSALLRVANLKDRASSSSDAPGALAKLQDDLRKLSEDLEQGFTELQEAMGRCAVAQHLAATSGRCADLLIEVAPVACLLIDASGVVIEANPAAGRALNMSHGRLPGKSFLLFMNGEREDFLSRISDLVRSEHPSRWPITLRPREQSSTQATVVAAPQTDDRVMILLLPAQEDPERNHVTFPADGTLRHASRPAAQREANAR
jgi:PAS domain-containing protein